jgi:hypothetical protein
LEKATGGAEAPPAANLKTILLYFYRFDVPRDAFLTLALFSPRAPVRGAFGAAFLRAARFTFLRSSLSVMVLVFAMIVIFSLLRNFCRSRRRQLSALKPDPFLRLMVSAEAVTCQDVRSANFCD